MSVRRVAAWTVGGTAVAAGLQVLLMMVAARHMHLADFGLLAVVNTVLAIVLSLQEMGLSSYCIYAGEQSRRNNSTLFWVGVILAFIAAIVLCFSASLIGDLFRISGVEKYLYILAVNLVVVGATSQFQANFVRIMRADIVSKIEILARIISFFIAVTMILWGVDGVLSIILGVFIFSILKFFLLFIMAHPDWRPCIAFDKAFARKAISYGAYQGGSQLVNQLRTRLDVILVSRLLGKESVGLYSLAKDLLDYPMRIFQPLMGRLLLPKLAATQGNSEAMVGLYLRGLKLTAWVAVAVYGLMTAFAVPMVKVIYGEKLIMVAALMPALLIFSVLRALGVGAGMLAQATGHTGREFYWNLAGAAIMSSGLVFVAFLATHVSGFAFGLSIIQVVVTLAAFPLFLRHLADIGFSSYVRAWILPVLFSLTVAALFYWLRLHGGGHGGNYFLGGGL